MRNQLLRRLGDNRPQLITLGIVAIFAAMLGCGGGGGGGGGTTSTSTTSTSTTSTSTTSTSTTSTSTTSTSTTAGSTTSETTGSTGSSLPANRIFFQDSSLDIKHMNPDGSDEQTYSPIDPGFKAFAQNPVNSNIKAFAFTAIPSNPPTFAQYDIYINSSVSLTGATKLTSIAKADVGSIMFTPDGSKIVFTAATGTMVAGDNGPVPEYSYQLFVIDSAVPNQTPIPLDAADDAYVAPTGLRIVYTYWPLSSANPRIATINIDGTNKTILTHPSGPISTANYMPQYSKDGTKICFGSNRTAQFEIWRMNSNGGSPNQVTNINSNSEDRCYGSSFSGDGSEVAFTRISSSVGNAGVYRVPSAGGTELLIRPGFVQPWIYWSPPSSSMPGRGVGSASTPLGFGTSIRIKKLLGIEEN